MTDRVMDKEVESYLRKIAHLRAEHRHGRAVQYCNAALEIVHDPLLKNVILTFKGDSLYKIGKKTQQDDIIQDARNHFCEVLKANPDDHLAQACIERIDRYL
ncbi:MAG: hypothetical protein HZB92_04800 [Euryarchaeota archaeon]|nr:hypothetical protein [Euryarchaeota archaeon]